MARNKNSRTQAKNTRSQRGRSNAINPPSIRSNVTYNHRYRFVSTSGSATTVDASALLTSCGAVCYDADAFCASITKTARIRRVSIWSPVASQGTSSTCSVTWTADDNEVGASTLEISDSSVSTSHPAHISCAPPPRSLASWWFQVHAGNLFTIVAPTGSIVDVELDQVLCDQGSIADVATIAVAAGVLGSLYYFPLDGTTDIFTPVSLNTTT